MKIALSTILLTLFVSSQAQVKSSELRYKAAKSIESHIKEKLGDRAEKYEPLNFGPVATIKPLEYIELEELLRIKYELPSMKSHYGRRLDSVIAANDSMIQTKKKEIMERSIRVSYEINHSFQLALKDDVVEIHDAQFFLSHDLKIKNLKYNYRTTVTEKESKIYYHYLMRYPLVETGDAQYDQHVSDEIYDFFEDRFIELDYDDAFLQHMLSVFYHIYENGYMDLDELGQEKIEEYASDQGMTGYRKIKTSPMYAIELTDTTTGEDTLIGYKMFHVMSYKDPETGTKFKQGFYFEFDLYYMITGVFRLEEPWDKYFED